MRKDVEVAVVEEVEQGREVVHPVAVTEVAGHAVGLAIESRMVSARVGRISLRTPLLWGARCTRH